MLDARCLRSLRTAALTVLGFLAFSSALQAQTVTLAWNANTEPDLAGYRVEYGTQSGNPTTMVDVGNVTSRQFSGLQIGVTYYFRVRAYNTSALVSSPSGEVSYTPQPPPPAPTLSAVSPASGPTSGGTLITVTGTNFVSGATIRVNGVLATGVTFLSSTQVRGTTPAGTAGARSVQVTNPDGQSATLASAFTYTNPAPTVTSVSPTSGPTSGGTLITVTGTNFVSGATIRVNGVLATGVTFLSSTQVRGTTPAGTAGARSVQVANPDGQSATLANAFTYSNAAPTVTSVSPTSGPTTGGTTITVTGTNFVSGATIRVNGVLATGVTFVSATQVRGTTPAGTAGARSVQVTNPDGQSATLANGFTYTNPAPTVTAVSPTSGPTTGGTTITVAGSNFVSGATIRVNGVLATGVTFVSATQVRGTTPAGTAGARSVQVTNPDGQSATLANAFTYTSPAPTVTAVSPTSGPTTGGTPITVTGTNFVSGATIRVNGVLATGVTFVSATQVRGTTPAGTAGARSVQVTNPDGQSATLANAFTYVTPTAPAPTATAVSPTSGPTTGGTTITVAGSNFVSGAAIRVNGVLATGVTFVSATQVRGTTPAGAAGARSVQVTNPDGQSATLANAFTYVNPAPTATSVSPTSGPVAGGTVITVTGSNFLSGATIRVNGVLATGVTFLSATQVRGTTPAGTAGARSVQVSNPDGQSATLASAFTYVDGAPQLTSVQPTSGPIGGGTSVTLRGSNFRTGSTVRFAGRTATNIVVVNATTITAATPTGTAGRASVQVTAPDTSSGSLPDAYTYTNGSTEDGDGDGLPTQWEQQYGLNPNSGVGNDGATGDPDSDGLSNLAEYQRSTHPRGLLKRYLAEGVVNSFFNTRLAIANPQTTEAKVLLTFVDANGQATREYVAVPPRARRTVDAATIPALAGASFSTTLESDQVVVLDRLMSWAGTAYAAHAETAVERPATTWYLAEGATHGQFELFYLLMNPSAAAAEVQIRYLRPSGSPITRFYTVPAGSRFTIWVDQEHRDLQSTDVSAEITSTNNVPIIVERSMYLNTSRRAFKGGHNSAGVTAPSTNWFLAEGSTGGFFSMFILLANPGQQDATVRTTYMLASGTPIVKTYTVAASTRKTINVAVEDKRLADTSVSVKLESSNGVPIIVERTMWWPGSGRQWTEGHNAFGTTTTGARWLLAEGEQGGPQSIMSFVLVANTSAAAANVRVTLLYESGAEQSANYTVQANSRFTVPIDSAFPGAVGKRFAVLVESLNPTVAGNLVVERAMYWNTDEDFWGAGSNAIGTKLN